MNIYIRRTLAVLLVMVMTITALPLAAIAEEMQSLAVLTEEQLEELLAVSEEEDFQEDSEEAEEAELLELPAVLEEITPVLPEDEVPEADAAPADEAAEDVVPEEQEAEEENAAEMQQMLAGYGVNAGDLQITYPLDGAIVASNEQLKVTWKGHISGDIYGEYVFCDVVVVEAGRSFSGGDFFDANKIKNYGKIPAGSMESGKDYDIAVVYSNQGSARVYSPVVRITALDSKYRAKSVEIQHNGKDAGKNMNVYLDKSTVKLTAKLTPDKTIQRVTWKSSDKKIAEVSADGVITPIKKGKVTISATAIDGSKKKDSITINVKRLVNKIEITGATELTAGKTTALKAKVSPSDANKKTVTWKSSDSSVATVDSEGVVKAAKDISARKTVTITATAKDDSGVVAKHKITVCPKASSVMITRNGSDAGKNVEFDMSKGNGTLQLGGAVLPAAASQLVKWSSSDKKIATISENGLITAVNPGKVTITATAKDGTKKKDSIAVTIQCSVKKLEIKGKAQIGSKDTTTLKTVFTPSNTKNKSVTWKSSDTSIAKVDSKGVVTAKKVTSRKSVTITATAKEGGLTASFKLTVCPKAESISISVGGVAATKGVVNLGNASPTLQLKASVSPSTAAQVVTWKSSDKSIATVSETGLVTGKKKGSVTIKASGANGKKASFTVDVIKASADKDFSYKVVNGAITITAYKGSGTSVVIPKRIGIYVVDTIGANAFKNKSAITSITLPSGLLKIADYAFYGCKGLLTITVPKKVNSIASHAFGNCGNMLYKATKGTYAYRWGKENGLIVEADSKANLQAKLKKKASCSSFAEFHYDDYDGDCQYEAFAIIGGDWYYDVWYVSSTTCKCLLRGIGMESVNKLGEDAPIIFTVEEGYGGSGSTSHAWVVNKGKVSKLKGNFSGLTKGEENEFYIHPGYFDASTDGTGHTWKPYYLYLSGTTMKEYGAIKITEKQLLKFDGAEKILNSIKGDNITIKSILYRANNIINISYVKNDGYRGHNYYVTLRYDKTSVKKIDSGSGYYRKAHDSSIATYPKKFVNPS